MSLSAVTVLISAVALSHAPSPVVTPSLSAAVSDSATNSALHSANCQHKHTKHKHTTIVAAPQIATGAAAHKAIRQLACRQAVSQSVQPTAASAMLNSGPAATTAAVPSARGTRTPARFGLRTLRSALRLDRFPQPTAVSEPSVQRRCLSTVTVPFDARLRCWYAPVPAHSSTLAMQGKSSRASRADCRGRICAGAHSCRVGDQSRNQQCAQHSTAAAAPLALPCSAAAVGSGSETVLICAQTNKQTNKQTIKQTAQRWVQRWAAHFDGLVERGQRERVVQHDVAAVIPSHCGVRRAFTFSGPPVAHEAKPNGALRGARLRWRMDVLHAARW